MVKKKINQILSLLNENKLNEAESLTTNLLNKNKENIDIENILAIVFAAKKKYPQAIKILEGILEKNPFFKDALINLGNIYRDLRDYSNAKIFYKKFLELDKNNIFVLFELAKTFDLNDQYYEAEKIYKKLLIYNPHNNNILYESGKNKIFLEKLNEAKKIINNINDDESFKIEKLILKSLIFAKETKYDLAKKNLELAKSIDPNNAKPYFYLANIYAAEHQHTLAIETLKKSLTLEDSPQSRYNLSIFYLCNNNFEKGWEFYKYRGSYYFFLNLINKKPIWDGKNFDGTLIVHGEQGIGDEILFSSMFNELLKIQKKIIVICESRLIKLLERSFKNIQFISKKSILPTFLNSKHIAAGDLGQFFRKKNSDFKIEKWIIPKSDLVNKYSEYFKSTGKINVGVAWTSFTSTSNLTVTHKNRQVSLDQIASCLPKDKFQLINLQYGIINQEIKKLEDNMQREIVFFNSVNYKNDIEDLAAIIMNCDLVVSIASFSASFSGALGKKTIAMVPVNYNWAWANNENNYSIWFPKIKILIQEKPDNWEKVLLKLKEEINILF
tara:strand:+ start:1329 stop:2996 length:1668 start_codon:yes stop_codon:yes gene_type:complete